MPIEVVYALADRAFRVTVTVDPGATVLAAIQASGLLRSHPDVDLNRQRVGIFARRVKLDQPVFDGDRIEVYRPLELAPDEARRRRLECVKRGTSAPP